MLVPTHPIESPRLVYVEVPKAGCTSIKTLLSPLKGGPPEPWEDIHHWFGYTHALDHHQMRSWLLGRWKHYFRFTVVRHPQTRFESFFDGRLRPEADINDFALNHLHTEQDIHAARQTDLIGWNFGCFDFVGKIEHPRKIAERLSEVLGSEVTMPHLNISPSPKREPLSRQGRRAVRDFYRADYELLGYR